MKKQTIYLLIAIGVLLLVIFNWDKLMAFAKPKSTSTGGSGTAGSAATSGSGGSGGSVTTNPNAFLKKGSTGASVKELQKMIMDGWGTAMLPQYGADGNFGDETEAALIKITGGSSTTLSGFRFNYYNPQLSQQGRGLSYAAGSGLSQSGEDAASSSLWDFFKSGLTFSY